VTVFVHRLVVLGWVGSWLFECQWVGLREWWVGVELGHEKWTHDHVWCSESDDATWSVGDVSSASEDVYTCVATNSAGSSVARTRLDVTGEILLLSPYVFPPPHAAQLCCKQMGFITHPILAVAVG